MPSRFVLELSDAVTGSDEHIGSSGERNGVIAALARSDWFCEGLPAVDLSHADLT